MNILGISAYYHDAAAALVRAGQIIAAAQEERFTRKKHDAGFPRNAVQYCLREGGVRAQDLDAVVFYDKPFLKFERILETYFAFAPKGYRSFAKGLPVWIKEKMFQKDMLLRELAATRPAVVRRASGSGHELHALAHLQHRQQPPRRAYTLHRSAGTMLELKGHPRAAPPAVGRCVRDLCRYGRSRPRCRLQAEYPDQDRSSQVYGVVQEILEPISKLLSVRA